MLHSRPINITVIGFLRESLVQLFVAFIVVENTTKCRCYCTHLSSSLCCTVSLDKFIVQVFVSKRAKVVNTNFV